MLPEQVRCLSECRVLGNFAVRHRRDKHSKKAAIGFVHSVEVRGMIELHESAVGIDAGPVIDVQEATTGATKGSLVRTGRLSRSSGRLAEIRPALFAGIHIG